MPRYIRHLIVLAVLSIIVAGFVLWQAMPAFKTTFDYIKDNVNRLIVLNKIIAHNPNDKAAYLMRGKTYERLCQDQNAIKDFTKAIELDPKSPPYDLRGNAYARAGQYSQAIDDYSKGIKNGLQFCYIRRASVYHNQTDQPNKAIEDYTKYIDLDPVNHHWCFLDRGSVYAGLGEYQKAIEDYNKIISGNLDRDNPLAYENRSIAYKKIGLQDKAIDDLKNAITIYTKQLQRYDKTGQQDMVKYENAKICMLRKKLERK